MYAVWSASTTDRLSQLAQRGIHLPVLCWRGTAKGSTIWAICDSWLKACLLAAYITPETPAGQ
eukprot:5162839-Pyramimonas_sp.AAC.1